MGKSIGEDIREFLGHWMEARSSRTLQVLADLTKISYNTLRRIHIGQVQPNLETALAILNYVATPQEAATVINQHFPEAGRYYQRLLSKPATTFAPDLSSEFQDFNCFMTLALAFMGKASKDSLRHFLGHAGLITADRLCRSGALKWNDDQLVVAGGEKFCIRQDADTVNAMLGHIVSILKARGEKPFATVASVSKKDGERLKRLITECVTECTAIIENSDGPEIVAISLVHTSLTEGLI
ncbi:MAG TPA: hypothetical protein VE954_12675 [Oligoflexus sp.]|uniref:hypothetical protein n=1 Tax=Oligoflexus sp. TaxID=1971216 RepID=UPI002D494165|nr:hypothetical protein [Oligoflexus sp.]HYX33962.1 hypothetical protein [Oligoflexus sp.]